MPLLPGSSRESMSSNISELRKSGRPEAQAVAIAMRVAGKARKRPKAMKKESYNDGDEKA